MSSRCKAAEPLTSKESDEVSKAFQRIYKRGPSKWPQLLQVDPGCEFMGAVTKVMENNKSCIFHWLRNEISGKCFLSHHWGLGPRVDSHVISVM